ncbi:hypothetical protein L0337_08960 [candidate division KSB1 bacterium]|nr:hypothetical protein [candidate division KSB1 bacterium]
MHQQITILFPEIAAGDFVAVLGYGFSSKKSHVSHHDSSNNHASHVFSRDYGGSAR